MPNDQYCHNCGHARAEHQDRCGRCSVADCPCWYYERYDTAELDAMEAAERGEGRAR